MQADSTLLLLFAAATAVALVARRLHVPYTVGLVLAGLGLGAVHPDYGIHLTRDLLYSVFLPGLVFEAAYHLDFREFRKSWRAILALAVPGVVAAIGATASLLVASSHAMGSEIGFGWSDALVFSALIAATDPIAVVALFKSLGAPKRLGVLTEGESLANDGTAIVLFTLIYTAVTSSEASGMVAGTVEFFKVAGLGLVVGGVIAFVASHVIRRVDDPMIEITLTTMTAYGSFLVAEHFHVSGVIATVTAGMVCGNQLARGAMSATTRFALESFWEYVAFALNSLVFLLIGLEVRVGALVTDWAPIAIAFVAVTIGRAAVVFAVSALLRPTSERIPWRWSVMLTWGGLRGALSMVLALALPSDFPGREPIVTMTFGVVLISIVLQGTTAGALLRALGLAGQAADPSRGERGVAVVPDRIAEKRS
jgi:CPA1 family monovalent cation:H+ antiporter